MSIKEWPLWLRPRERLLQQGVEQLSDVELLTLVFGTGTQQHCASSLAQQTLQRFDNVTQLFQADYQAFCQQPGVGAAKYATLHAAAELYRRSLNHRLQHQAVFNNGKTSREFLKSKLAHHQHEVFAALFLDTQHQLIAYEELFTGTIDCTVVHPRVLLQKALSHNAAAIIIAHNHPSGNSQASPADIELTHRLKKCLADLDIALLDHIIVTNHTTRSVASTCSES